FPYTTLFRSDVEAPDRAGAGEVVAGEALGEETRPAEAVAAGLDVVLQDERRRRAREPVVDLPADRLGAGDRAAVVLDLLVEVVVGADREVERAQTEAANA